MPSPAKPELEYPHNTQALECAHAQPTASVYLLSVVPGRFYVPGHTFFALLSGRFSPAFACERPQRSLTPTNGTQQSQFCGTGLHTYVLNAKITIPT